MAISLPKKPALGSNNIQSFPKTQYDKIKEIIDALNNITDGTFSTTTLTATTVNGTTVAAGTLTASGATSLGVTNLKAQVTDTGGAFATPIVLTTAQSGRTILLDDAAGLDITLPAIGAGDIGTTFRFFINVEVTSNSYRITAATGDLLFGHVVITDKDAATGDANALISIFRPNGSSHLVTTSQLQDGL